MATPILWSKLDSADDVTSPQLCGTGGEGVEGTAETHVYSAAKFSNGYNATGTGNNLLFGTSENSINLDKGTIEFWTKIGFAYDISGTTYIFFDFIDTSNGGIYLRYEPATDKFILHAMSQGASQVTVEASSSAQTFSVGDLIHIGSVWDRTGADIGSSVTLALYIDDTQDATSTTTWATDAVASNMYVGSATDNGYPCISIIDNLKTYDECKINFGDRFDEGISGATSQKRRKIISAYTV